VDWAAVSVVCASSFEGVGWYWMEWVCPKTPIAASPPAESSLGNQAGSSNDSPREQPLASSPADPSQSPIEFQQDDRW